MPDSVDVMVAAIRRDLAALERHDQAVAQAAHLLRQDYRDPAAAELEWSWRELNEIAGSVAVPLVYALPPEPPAGAVVEYVADAAAGTRTLLQRRATCGMWHPVNDQPDGPSLGDRWSDVLRFAGPAGVRVVREAP